MDPQQRITAKVALRTPWLRDCCVSRSPRQKGLSHHGSRAGSTSCPPPAQRTHNCRAMSPGVESGRGSPIASPCAVPEGPAQPWFRGTRPPSSRVQPVHALPPLQPRLHISSRSSPRRPSCGVAGSVLRSSSLTALEHHVGLLSINPESPRTPSHLALEMNSGRSVSVPEELISPQDDTDLSICVSFPDELVSVTGDTPVSRCSRQRTSDECLAFSRNATSNADSKRRLIGRRVVRATGS